MSKDQLDTRSTSSSFAGLTLKQYFEQTQQLQLKQI